MNTLRTLCVSVAQVKCAKRRRARDPFLPPSWGSAQPAYTRAYMSMMKVLAASASRRGPAETGGVSSAPLCGPGWPPGHTVALAGFKLLTPFPPPPHPPALGTAPCDSPEGPRATPASEGSDGVRRRSLRASCTHSGNVSRDLGFPLMCSSPRTAMFLGKVEVTWGGERLWVQAVWVRIPLPGQRGCCLGKTACCQALGLEFKFQHKGKMLSMAAHVQGWRGSGEVSPEGMRQRQTAGPGSLPCGSHLCQFLTGLASQ